MFWEDLLRFITGFYYLLVHCGRSVIDFASSVPICKSISYIPIEKPVILNRYTFYSVVYSVILGVMATERAAFYDFRGDLLVSIGDVF